MPPARPRHLALLIWILIQLIALGFCAAKNNSREALTIMLIVQIAASALLASELMRDAWNGLIVIVAAIPFVQVAAALSASSSQTILRSDFLLCLWLVNLLIFARLSNSLLARAVLNVAASVSAIGGAMLVYFRDEFGSPIISSRLVDLLPASLSTTLVVGLILVLTNRYALNRQVIHARC